MKKISAYLFPIMVCLFVLGAPVHSYGSLVVMGNDVVYDNQSNLFWFTDLPSFTSKTYDEQNTAIDWLTIGIEFNGNPYSIEDFRMAGRADILTLQQNWDAAIAQAFEPTAEPIMGGTKTNWEGRINESIGNDDFCTSVWLLRSTFMVTSYSWHDDFDELKTDSDNDILGAWVCADTPEIPIPGAVWLLGSGLIGLVGLRKKLKK